MMTGQVPLCFDKVMVIHTQVRTMIITCVKGPRAGPLRLARQASSHNTLCRAVLCAQVSTEYSGYKREAEVKMEELQHERDQAREELQLAMVAGSVSKHSAASLLDGLRHAVHTSAACAPQHVD